MDENRIPTGREPGAEHIRWTARLARLGQYLPPRVRLTGGLAQGLMSAAAAIVAYLPTKPLGLREGFWGSITAIAVVQTELGATQSSARDQFAGAAIGGLVSAVIVSLAGEHIASYALAVVLSVLACWLCNVSSAARLSGSTATIVVLVPHQGSVEWMMLSRLAEVGWGLTVGIGVVWLVNRAEKSFTRAHASKAGRTISSE
jgi:uncharacterized membrane protein YgaE (UPF0421/DUF939 family)